MDTLTVGPKAITDRGVQAIRLRGLAGLLRATGDNLQEVTNLEEVMFFLASALDEIAAAGR
jgi:hypothetical protein